MTDRRRGLGAMLGLGGGRKASSPPSPQPASRRKDTATSGQRLRRMVTPMLLVVAVVAAISILAVPVRSHMARSADIDAAENVLAELMAMNEADAARADALRTDDEVEHVARRDFGLAKPGEEIYHVLAPAVDGPRVPNGWPFNHLGLRLVLE